jgi:hypothetical protein
VRLSFGCGRVCGRFRPRLLQMFRVPGHSLSELRVPHMSVAFAAGVHRCAESSKDRRPTAAEPALMVGMNQAWPLHVRW